VLQDTIKVTGVGQTPELLANTFVRAFVAVEGMASWYHR
jgi:phosphatidate phosphatase APP1